MKYGNRSSAYTSDKWTKWLYYIFVDFSPIQLMDVGALPLKWGRWAHSSWNGKWASKQTTRNGIDWCLTGAYSSSKLHGFGCKELHRRKDGLTAGGDETRWVCRFCQLPKDISFRFMQFPLIFRHSFQLPMSISTDPYVLSFIVFASRELNFVCHRVWVLELSNAIRRNVLVHVSISQNFNWTFSPSGNYDSLNYSTAEHIVQHNRYTGCMRRTRFTCKRPHNFSKLHQNDIYARHVPISSNWHPTHTYTHISILEFSM